MILAIEIGLALFGLYALISGKYSLGKGRNVEGSKARVLGFLCLLPVPLAFGAGIVLGVIFAVFNQPMSPLIVTGIEVMIVAVVVFSVSWLGKHFYREQQAGQFGANPFD